MKKILFISACLSLLLMLSCCRDDVKRHYYDTGELQYEAVAVSDSTHYFKEYYKNGRLMEEGLVKNKTIFEGQHKLYFSDGTLHWEGDYKNSVIQGAYKEDWEWKDVDKYFEKIEFYGNPPRLEARKEYYFRIIMPVIHPQLYIVVDENFDELDNLDDNQEMYPFKFYAEAPGQYIIYVVFMNKDGLFTTVNSRLKLHIPIVE